MKIFKEKAANDWKERANFEKKKGKYTLLKRVKHINYEPYIVNFDYEEIKKDKKIKLKLNEKNAEIIKEITNLDKVRRTYSSYNVD